MGAGLKWAGWGILLLGGIVFVGLTADMVAKSDFDQAAGLLIPLLFVGAGAGLLRLAHKVQTDASFDLPDVAKWVFVSVGGVMIVGGIILSFDDPGAFFLIFMGLVFAGAGWFAGAVMATPEGKKKMFVEGMSAIAEKASGGPGAVQAGAYIEISEDATDEEARAAADNWRTSMISQRPGWATGRIPSNTSSIRAFWIIPLVMILIGVSLLSGVMGGDQILVFVGAIAVLVGLFFLWTLFQRWRQNSMFGASVLALDQSPIAPGAQLIGTLEAPAPRKRFADGKFTLIAECAEIIRSEGANERTNYETRTLWHEKKTVFAKGEKVLSVRVRFDLPPDLPDATLVKSAAVQVRWSLRVEAKGATLDFSEVFDLPVLRMSGD